MSEQISMPVLPHQKTGIYENAIRKVVASAASFVLEARVIASVHESVGITEEAKKHRTSLSFIAQSDQYFLIMATVAGFDQKPVVREFLEQSSAPVRPLPLGGVGLNLETGEYEPLSEDKIKRLEKIRSSLFGGSAAREKLVVEFPETDAEILLGIVKDVHSKLDRGKGLIARMPIQYTLAADLVGRASRIKTLLTTSKESEAFAVPFQIADNLGYPAIGRQALSSLIEHLTAIERLQPAFAAFKVGELSAPSPS